MATSYQCKSQNGAPTIEIASGKFSKKFSIVITWWLVWNFSAIFFAWGDSSRLSEKDTDIELIVVSG